MTPLVLALTFIIYTYNFISRLLDRSKNTNIETLWWPGLKKALA